MKSISWRPIHGDQFLATISWRPFSEFVLTFHLAINSIQKRIVELSIRNELDNEELAEIFMTVFKDLKTKDAMVLRVIFFASMECLRNESELIQQIWEQLQEG